MATKVKIDIELLGKDKSREAFNRAQQSAKALGSTMAGTVTAISTAYLAVQDIIAKMMAIAEAPIKAGRAAETANLRVATSLQAAGRYSETAQAEINAFAAELQSASGYADDLVASITSQNVIMGLNVQQAEALTQASAALAKVTGQDLAAANKVLVGTLSGEAGELKKVIPAVGAFTQAQLRAGAAVDLVGKSLGRFITADAASFDGALMRVMSTFDDFLETIGLSFIKGIEASGMFGELEAIIRKMTTTVDGEAKPALEQLGETVGREVVKNFEVLLNLMGFAGKAIGALEWSIRKLSLAFDLATVPLNHVAILVGKAAAGFTGLGKIVSAFLDVMTGGIADIPALWDEMTASMDEYNGMIDQNAKFFAKVTDELFGVEKAADSTAAAMTRAATAAQPPTLKQRSMGRVNVGGQSREAAEAQVQAQRQIQAEIIALQTDGMDQYVVELTTRMQKAADMEADAQRKGYNITKDLYRLRTQLVDTYQRKLAMAYLEDRIAAADASGQTTRMIELQYKRELELLEQKLRAGKVLQDEYNAGVIEADRKAAEARRQTTGTRSMDEAVNKASTVVGALSGGVNSIVGTIGSMFGPWGQLIASLFQFFNQAPEEFQKLIQGLIQGIIEAPKNIAANIPVLVSELVKSIPDILMAAIEQMYTMVPTLILNVASALLEALPAVLGRIFSIGFWMEVAGNMYNALVGAFKNFWSVLFTGKGLETASQKAQATATRQAAAFGSDDPNAGGGEFKIKDADLRNSRRAKSFEQTFETTVENSGKGFADMLQEAWDKVMAVVRQFFQDMFTGLRDVWLWVYDSIFKPIISALQVAFQAVFDGFRGVWIWAYDTIINPWLTLFTQIWRSAWDNVLLPAIDGFRKVFEALGAIATTFVSALTTVWRYAYDSVVSPLLNGLREIWSLYIQAGQRIVDTLYQVWSQITGALAPVVSALSGAWTAAKRDVVDPLLTGLKSAWSGLVTAGTQLTETITAALGPNYWIEKGKAIWTGLSSVIKWPSLPTLPTSIANFRWPTLPALPSSIANFKWPSLPSMWQSGVDVWKGFSDSLSLNTGWIKSFGTVMWDGLAAGLYGGQDWLRQLFQSLIPGFGGGGGGGGVLGVFGLNRGGMVPAQGNRGVAAAFEAMGAIKMAEGGRVPGTGFDDSVPILGTPGEIMLSREQVASARKGSGQVVNFNFNVATGAVLDRSAARQLAPMVVDYMRRESRVGRNILSPDGVY